MPPKKTQYRHANELPRPKIHVPHAFQEQAEQLHPFNQTGSWILMDGDIYVENDGNDGIVKEIVEVQGDCPVCFQQANKKCARCLSVAYCSKQCQTKHWKQSHKKACKPNPKLYKYNVSLNALRGNSIADKYSKPYEFILIKPTEQLSSLEEICEVALESADSIMDVPGFGSNQIQPAWPMNNTRHPMTKKLCDQFGWTSGHYAVELVQGYRVAEDKLVAFVLNDDAFSSQPRMANSYYGGSIFPSVVRDGKDVRGNLVFFRVMLKKKQWKPPQAGNNTLMAAFSMTDDDQLQYEYELYPTSKLELALMLQERRKAIEEGAYTRRMWRYHLRLDERRIEVEERMGCNVAYLG